jgi:glutathionylspermidine synthase
MQRFGVTPRPHWRETVGGLGLVWHTAGAAPYWDEAAAYSFTLAEVDAIEKASATLYAMFVEAGEYVVKNRLFARFGIPDWCWPLVEDAWKSEPPALNYGRFDLGFDGSGPPKLFEFNCDTPTSLLEAAVVQWQWKEEVFPGYDQFNSLHDKLVAKWRDIGPYLKSPKVHFAHAAETTGEDAVTTAYLIDTAMEAGLSAEAMLVSDIGWDGARFLDLQDQEIATLYHLYPWEWLVNEPFGRNIAANQGRTAWIEPIWKMIWSNKAILPILWDLFPRHPNLLWATTDAPASGDYVRKPALAREGANVQIVRGGQVTAAKDGPYDSPSIYQGLYELPEFGGAYPVIGSWIVDGAPAGMGIREDGPITGNLARFVPHVISG